MLEPNFWDLTVAEDYRKRIIIDCDSPLLAFKANRDRFTDTRNQKDYAGLPHLGSRHSEDALTWNVFRSLQYYGALDIVNNELGIGRPRGILIWTIAPSPDEVNYELQNITGSLIRRFDGRLPGRISEPDVIVLGSGGVAVIECKLSEPDKTPSHMWEGNVSSVRKRRQIYEKEIPGFIRESITDEMIVPVYQLIRMAFYAVKIAEAFSVEPVLVSLVNGRSWEQEMRKFGKSPSELWQSFCSQMLGIKSLRCKALTWQNLLPQLQDQPLGDLASYLSTHPCLFDSQL